MKITTSIILFLLPSIVVAWSASSSITSRTNQLKVSKFSSSRSPHHLRTKKDGLSLKNDATTHDDDKEENSKTEKKQNNKLLNPLRQAITNSHWSAQCFTTIASCFLVHALSNRSPNLNPNLSQAIVCTLVGSMFPQLVAAAGTGAFAGMVGSNIIVSQSRLALLAFVTAVTWQIVDRFKLIVGFGGRLGTNAFVAMNLSLLLFGIPNEQISFSRYFDKCQLWSNVLTWEKSCVTVASTVFLSTIASYVRLTSRKPLNPIFASSATALICMLLTSSMTTYQYSSIMLPAFSVGSFIAMASETFLPSVTAFGVAGFLSGLWILALSPCFLGFGGKLGFTAFLGFSTYRMMNGILAKIKR